MILKHNFKGALFCKNNVAGVTVLILHMLSGAVLYLYQVS